MWFFSGVVQSKGDFLFIIIKYFQYATFLHRKETSWKPLHSIIYTLAGIVKHFTTGKTL